jgi:hypothetical protein
MMEYSYFKPVKNQMVELRQLIVSHIHSSSFRRWTMFLCARICESFIKGDTSQNRIYNRWIEDIENALRSVLTRELASHEAQDRLGDWLEVWCFDIGCYMCLYLDLSCTGLTFEGYGRT